MRFKPITNRFVVNALTHCAALLGNNFEKESIYKIVLDFIVYFGRKYDTIWRCPIQPQVE